MHYLPDNAVSNYDTELRIAFEHTALSIRFYKDLGVDDRTVLSRTEIYTKHADDNPLTFGRIMDSAVKNDDRFSAIRAAIEMGKNFDIAFGYENALINGNYATVIDGR
jgi:hypothetical protein